MPPAARRARTGRALTDSEPGACAVQVGLGPRRRGILILRGQTMGATMTDKDRALGVDYDDWTAHAADK